MPGTGDAVTIAAPATGTRTVTYDYAGPAVTPTSLLLTGQSNGTFPPALSETFAIPAGTLTLGEFDVGKGINGVVAQTGGTVTVGAAGQTTYDALNIGYSDNDGLGTYQLAGGSLTVNGQELVGEDSVGAFNQSGGTHAVVGNMLVGTYTAPARSPSPAGRPRPPPSPSATTTPPSPIGTARSPSPAPASSP